VHSKAIIAEKGLKSKRDYSLMPSSWEEDGHGACRDLIISGQAAAIKHN
jgi:hypothetical protein